MVRCGGALLAQPTSSVDLAELQSLGFAAVEEEAAEESGQHDGATDGATTLALVNRRNASEGPADCSHAALLVSDVKRSINFWSLLHFRPTRLFTTEGARAAWISAPWTSLSLELIEVPSIVLSSQPCEGGAGAGAADESAAQALGMMHLCLDVTPLGIALPQTLGLLERRSQEAFGRSLAILAEPHQQMMAELVCEVAVVRAPDGVQLELIHRQGKVSGAMAADWTL